MTFLRRWSLASGLLRYRRCFKVTFALVAFIGYCLVLGNYAIAKYERVSLAANKSVQDAKRQQVYRYSHANDRATLEAQLRLRRPNIATQPPGATPLPLDLAPLEAELEDRRRQVWRTCDKYKLGGAGGGQPNAWEFFVDSRNHIVWCAVYKAASSTWMYYFNLLGGYKETYLQRTNTVPLTLARKQFPRPSVSQLLDNLPESLSFMIVRDPFERLLSTYRNKIESFRHRFYHKMAREMIDRYRKPPANGVPESKLSKALASPTFSEFVSYVTDMATRKKHRFDEHWAPYHSFCTPCSVNFTVIGKLETFDRDQEYIIHKGKIDHVLKKNTRRLSTRVVINRGRGATTTKGLVEKYFGQLTVEQVERLYAIYRIDFEMFGYNATKYFELAIKPES